MGLTHVKVALRPLPQSGESYEADFLVDAGATDSMAPTCKLRAVGFTPRGRMTYELADGSKREYDFGGAEIEFMGEVTYGRIIFGPDDAEPILGVTALESVGVYVDPRNQTLKRLPAVSLK